MAVEVAQDAATERDEEDAEAGVFGFRIRSRYFWRPISSAAAASLLVLVLETADTDLAAADAEPAAATTEEAVRGTAADAPDWDRPLVFAKYRDSDSRLRARYLSFASASASDPAETETEPEKEENDGWDDEIAALLLRLLPTP